MHASIRAGKRRLFKAGGPLALRVSHPSTIHTKYIIAPIHQSPGPAAFFSTSYIGGQKLHHRRCAYRSTPQKKRNEVLQVSGRSLGDRSELISPPPIVADLLTLLFPLPRAQALSQPLAHGIEAILTPIPLGGCIGVLWLLV